MMYAQIIVNIKTRELDQLFTYQLSREMSEIAKCGDRVVVPFARNGHYVDGVIWSLSNCRPSFKVKNIYQILDSAYRLSKSQVIMMQSLRKYYGATYQEAFQTVLPNVQSLVKNTSYTVTDAPFMTLPAGGTYEEEVLLKRTSKKEISNALKRGAIVKHYNFSIKVAPRTTEWICKKYKNLEDALNAVGKRATKKQRILKHVAYLDKIILQNLAKATQATRADVLALVKCNLLTYQKMTEQTSLKHYALTTEKATNPPLTEEQAFVLERFKSLAKPAHVMLEGVTGSGKTRIYIELAKTAIANNRQVLVLVPEISLTPQLISRFSSQISDRIGVVHTHVKPLDKALIFQQIASGDIDIIIGARSALFAPMVNLGLIIVDEEHETSYKSETIPRYHAVELAYLLALELNIDYLAGSATPSITTQYKVGVGMLKALYLKQRIGTAGMADMAIIDLKGGCFSIGNISKPLFEQITRTFEKGEQVLLFHNRKGYARYLQCHHCGHVEMCVNCDVPLTLYKAGASLQCHYCGYRTTSKMYCSACSGPLGDKGIGIEKVTRQLKTVFPHKNIVQLDADITRVQSHFIKILEDFSNGCIDCLIGTQVLAKGLDFPNVTLVGVLNADQLLNMPDYAATERAYQLLMQVAGRAGRQSKAGKVLIQTFQPDHMLFRYLLNNAQSVFVDEEKRIRDILGYPPYGVLFTINVSSEQVDEATVQANSIYYFYKRAFEKHTIKADIYPPLAPYYAKIKHRHFMKMTIKTSPENDLKILKMLYLGIVKNKYKLIQPNCWVDIDFDR